MNSSVEVVRQWFGLSLLVVAAVMIIFYIYLSLKLAAESARGEKSIAKDEKIPLKYAIFVMSAALIARVGVLILVPELVRFGGLAVIATLIIGLSVWANLRHRLYYAKKRTSDENIQE